MIKGHLLARDNRLGFSVIAMTTRIDATTVEAISRELMVRGSHLFARIDTELQDDSTFLLLTVDLPSSEEPRVQEAKDLLKDIVGRSIADKVNEYSWMGLIRVKGEIRDSVSSEMLLPKD